MFKSLGFLTTLAVAYLWIVYVKQGPVYESDKSLKGKTILLTGGNSGIGKAACFELAKMGARVIIASRNVAKSEVVKNEIVKETGNNEVFVKRLDLADFGSVRTFAKEFIEKEKYLDYLINNAGVLSLSGKTKSGLSNIYAINHFGHFLLTNLLTDTMKSQAETRPVRIINLSSEAYRIGDIKKEYFYTNATSVYERFMTYGSSKLANILFTNELNRRFKDHDITVYSVHPGTIRTELGGHFTSLEKLAMLPAIIFLRDPYYGCQTILYCALDGDVVEQSGGYFTNCALNPLPQFATDQKAAEYLWEESLKITGLA